MNILDAASTKGHLNIIKLIYNDPRCELNWDDAAQQINYKRSLLQSGHVGAFFLQVSRQNL